MSECGCYYNHKDEIIYCPTHKAAPDLRAALRDWHDMFEWGDFNVDFSNGVTHNGIDEGDVKGNAMLMGMLERTRQALDIGKEE